MSNSNCSETVVKLRLNNLESIEIVQTLELLKKLGINYFYIIDLGEIAEKLNLPEDQDTAEYIMDRISELPFKDKIEIDATLV